MNKAKLNNILLLAILFALAPGVALAQAAASTNSTTNTAPTTIGVPQGFTGIFSCNQNGSYAMSVGALGASGGVYVPVADASVELNTGTLVYKECVLREVVDAQRQAATAGLVQQGTNQVLTGRNGSALFVKYQSQEITTVRTNAIVAYLQGSGSSLDPSVQNAVAQGYAVATYNPSSALACPYQGATTDFTSSNPQAGIWNDLLAVASPCNPLFGYIDANDIAQSVAEQESNCLQNEWLWGGGFYSVTSGTGGPCEQEVITPSSQVNGLYSQLLQSPFNQLQSANDIGQMVGGLFGGISNQVLSSTGGGLVGITQPIGNQPSYLQQAVNQETQNLQSAVANAALVNLDAALQIEQSYYNTMSQIAGSIENTITQLRGAENSCWNQLITTVCSGSTPINTGGVTRCTDSNGDQLQISTSTEFSQAVINSPNSQITTLASTTANNLQVSLQALSLINQLIQNVSGSSADAQAVAVEQLNQLIANNELHTEAELETAQSQEQSVQSAMTTLGQNTPQLWAGTDPNNTTNDNIPWNGSVGATIQVSDPGVGWCNFQNQTTIQQWETLWST